MYHLYRLAPSVLSAKDVCSFKRNRLTYLKRNKVAETIKNNRNQLYFVH